MKRIVFACVHNAGRSQMAAAFFNAIADPKAARAVSAGTRPGAEVHPAVVEAMREVGFDLSGARPQLLTDELARDTTLLVTLGCGEECPLIPGARTEDWPLEDPKDKPRQVVVAIRDDIRRRVRDLVEREAWAPKR